MEMDMNFWTTLITIVVIVVVILLAKAAADWWSTTNEAKEVRKDVDSALERFKQQRAEAKKAASETEDALTQMERNIAELREYYVISKRQARKSFSAALLACILGFLLYAAGILLSYDPNGQNVIAYSTVGGSLVEVIAGLFFWLYAKAIEQMNLYHSSLIETQSQLAAIELVPKMDKANRDKAYAYIITKTMDKSQSANIDLSSNGSAASSQQA
jgi:Sec-independent protein translocase protein TatA